MAISVGDVLRHSWLRMKGLSLQQLGVVAVLIALLMVGNAMQIICINYWLASFNGHHYGCFTTMTVSSIIYAIFFLVVIVVWAVVKRPCFKFAWTLRSWVLIIVIGFFDMFNSWLSIYATPKTPEVLQALFTSLTSLFTFGFTKLFLGDARNYLHPLSVIAMVLMVVGVAVASFSDFTGNHIDNDRKYWSMIFFASVPMSSVYNVLQAKYMTDFTDENMKPGDDGAAAVQDADDLPIQYGGTAEPTSPTGRTQKYVASSVSAKGDDSTVKFFMLFGDTFFQAVFCFVFLPADALPWYGRSSTVRVASTNFVDGLACLFNCHNNLIFCILYSLGFVFTYVGGAYLNHYSATLCSMIGQLSSPMTGIVLLLIPAWDLNATLSPWYWTTIAIVLLVVGTVIFAAWEEMGEIEKEGHEEAVAHGHEDDGKTPLVRQY